MKSQIVNIVILSLVLTVILSFYFISTISFLSLKNIGFVIGILLILYFLFINVTFHFIDFRDNLKIKRLEPKGHQNITTPRLRKSFGIFFSILIVVTILTYLNTKFVQKVPF